MTEAYTLPAQRPTSVGMTTVPIELFVKDKSGADVCLGPATAFCDRYGSQKYLITNWYCITGRDPRTGQPRACDGVVPTFIRAHFPYITLGEGANFSIVPLKRRSIDFEIENKGWIMHSDGQSVDLAAVPIPECIPTICIQDNIAVFDPMLGIGDEVFILGFPRGVTPVGTLPIWKRASIASEPIYLAFGEKCYLVDSATREGMSGSPVIGRIVSKEDYPNMMGNGPVTNDTIFAYQPGFSFLGVYSGRIGVKDALEAQIGKVWRPNLVQEMLSTPRILSYDFHKPA